ncbi:MAG: sugar nucleotide-binding protein, partial [Gammaproteobacteria bacterium]
MKILLFGKNGQVGSALAPVLAARGEVIALGRDSLGGLSGDLSEPRRIVETIRRVTPDLVVNAAAYTAVDRAEEESTLAHTI